MLKKYSFFILGIILGLVMVNSIKAAERETLSENIEKNAEWRKNIPLLDLHTHISDQSVTKALWAMDANYIDRAVNLTPGRTPENFAKAKKKFDRDGQGRFFLYVNDVYLNHPIEDPEFGEKAAKDLEACVALGAKGFKVSKTLGLYWKDKEGSIIPIDDPRLDPIWEACARLDIPVSIHSSDPKAFWEPLNEDNERWTELKDHPNWSFHGEDFPSREEILRQRNRVIEKHPDVTFVCVHFGNNPENIDEIASLMRRYPNFHVDLAARLGEIGRHAPEKVRKLFIEFQDRIYFGTDFIVFPSGFILGAGPRLQELDKVRMFFDSHWTFLETSTTQFDHPTPIQGDWKIDAIDLPRKVLEKIYYINAERLLFREKPKSTSAMPIDNPVKHYNLAWTDSIQWDKVINIKNASGANWDEKVRNACQRLSNKGGGVIYFPAGEYPFKEDILLADGVVIRGAQTKDKAIEDEFVPATKFIFPQYKPTFEGDGTPNDTAFKTITLKSPTHDSQCGIVNVAIDYGSIYFRGGDNHRAGSERLVYGCRLYASARPISSIPTSWQEPWQRYTNRHRAAITVFVEQNALVANNGLVNSQEENFLLPGYILKDTEGNPKPSNNIIFDYDNRPGIVVNGYGLGGAGASGNDGTPETHPWGFRKGLQIRDNYIFSTGGYAIQFTGDGTLCAGNVIRFKPDVKRYTITGETPAKGSSTNGNRAVEMRGWRWTVKNNHYEVYRNRVGDSAYHVNDGEGLMHEDHVNSIIKDSKLIGNIGNTYISIYKTGGIDGLLVKGNHIDSQIFVVANRNRGPFFCRDVTIEDNFTPVIRIAGEPADNNIIRNNTNPITKPGRIHNEANARLSNNKGYEID